MVSKTDNYMMFYIKQAIISFNVIFPIFQINLFFKI